MTTTEPVEIPRDLLRTYDRPGPRYTSYPTAVEFDGSVDADEAAARIRSADRRSDEPLSLYVHVPFCAERCHFCACNVVITTLDRPVRRYLDDLRREVEIVCDLLPERRRVVQYHWGGGTPTHLDEEQIEEVWSLFADRFAIDPDGEIAIEVDPRVTTPGQLELLRSLGFNRVSLGVQSLDDLVQEAIHRGQTEAQTRETVRRARELGFDSVNVDLVYGLPHQTPERFEATLDGICDLRPDRLAVYSYAHVPWIKAHQEWMPTEALPSPEEKIELFARATERFIGAGYRPIGMDHFALPGDELSRALEERRLHRSFMGYTVRPAPDLLGFGISAIGDVDGAHVQNVKKLSTYGEALAEGRLPVERGCVLSAEDRLRRDVIQGIMCNLHVDVEAVEETHGIRFADHFARELEALEAGPVQEGFVVRRDGGIEVTPLGRFFIRNIAMIFDVYRREDPEEPVFSRTV